MLGKVPVVLGKAWASTEDMLLLLDTAKIQAAVDNMEEVLLPHRVPELARMYIEVLQLTVQKPVQLVEEDEEVEPAGKQRWKLPWSRPSKVPPFRFFSRNRNLQFCFGMPRAAISKIQ